MVRDRARVKTSDERETDSTDLKANAMKFVRNEHKIHKRDRGGALACKLADRDRFMVR